MKELAVAQRQVQDTEGQMRTYEYAILVGELPVSEGFSCESYGVCIRGQNGEEEAVSNITVSAARIDALLDLLVRNAVTPSTLRDVVDDWL